MNALSTPRISVVIVNFKVPEFLCQTIRSVTESLDYDRCEIIVVDNASGDNSQELVASAFPEVIWIGLKRNIGFGKACNVGARTARGEYLLFLNPDTIVQIGTLKVLADILDERRELGACGPRVLNHDGSFQAACRRSFPTPFNALAYMSGLARLFPKSSLLGAYNLTNRDPLESGTVDAVSGSCIMIRAELFKKIGEFDPAFFMYGEDLDLCARVAEAGLLVWYCADTTIVHFKGRSSARQAIKTRIAFYEAMILFSNKYHRSYGAFFPRWVIGLGIMLLATGPLVSTILRTSRAALIDVALVNFVFWLVIVGRFLLSPMPDPYTAMPLTMLGMHIFLSATFGLTFAARGLYSAEKFSTRNTLVSGMLASLIFMAGAYVVQVIALSRLAFLLSALLIPAALLLWRRLVPGFITRMKRDLFSTGSVIIVGDGPVAKRIVAHVENDASASICGIVSPLPGSELKAEFAGYPILGSIDAIAQIIADQHPALLIIAAPDTWYSHIVEALPLLRNRKLSIRWVPQSVFALDAASLPEEIPLKNFAL